MPYGLEPRHTLCCMLHCSLVGASEPRTDGCRPGSAPYPRQPVTIGDNRAIRAAPKVKSATIEFLIDGNTEMERKLQVGSRATVECRSVNGHSVAIQLVVAPAAGLKRGELKGRTDSFESAK